MTEQFAENAKKSVAPIDTSTLGPIRVDPNAIAGRAQVVRGALLCLADPTLTPEAAYSDRIAAMELARASDDMLAKLGWMLK